MFVAEGNYSFGPSSIQPIGGLITFSESPLRQLYMPHYDALVLTLEVGKHLMKRILVDPGSVASVLYLLALLYASYKPNNLNLERVLVDFNGLQTNSLGKIVLPISARLVTILISLMVVDEPSSFNTILGCTWIHAMKALPSLYHKMLSFLTS